MTHVRGPHRPGGKAIFSTATVGTMVVAALVIALASAGVFAANETGAVTTTNSSGSVQNQNQYTDKCDAYLKAAQQGQSNLGPDGVWYIRVTDPSGGTVLTQSPGYIVAVVSGGQFVSNGGANGTDNVATNNVVPLCANGVYADTPNAGGEYKVAASTTTGFESNNSKTDNFKVEEATPSPSPEPSPSPSPVPSPSPSPVASPSPSPVASPSPSPVASPSPSPVASPSPSATARPTDPPGPPPTEPPTEQPTTNPTPSPKPTLTATATASAMPPTELPTEVEQPSPSASPDRSAVGPSQPSPTTPTGGGGIVSPSAPTAPTSGTGSSRRDDLTWAAIMLLGTALMASGVAFAAATRLRR